MLKLSRTSVNCSWSIDFVEGAPSRAWACQGCMTDFRSSDVLPSLARQGQVRAARRCTARTVRVPLGALARVQAGARYQVESHFVRRLQGARNSVLANTLGRSYFAPAHVDAAGKGPRASCVAVQAGKGRHSCSLRPF